MISNPHQRQEKRANFLKNGEREQADSLLENKRGHEPNRISATDTGINLDNSGRSALIKDTDGSNREEKQPQGLGLIPLVVIIFYNVSGGPFGVEETIRSAGPFYTLVGFGICPLIWSLQESLITAELTCAYPHASGGVAWVEEAFGHTAGWMAGFLSWVAGATDNAIYPVLFLDYLLQVLMARTGEGEISDDDSSVAVSPFLRFSLLASTSIGLAYINWLGLDVVGTMSTAICVVALSPFVIVVLFGVFKVQPHRWLQMPESLSSVTSLTSPDFDNYENYTRVPVADSVASGADSDGFFSNAAPLGVILRPFINNLFWNFNSFDSTACYSEEIHDLHNTFPRAMLWSVLMVWLGYFIPLLVLLGACNDDVRQHDWVDGYIAVAAEQIVGSSFIGVWIVFAAGVSNLGQFQAELSSDAFQLMGMASRYGHIPKIFSAKSRHGTPTYALILGTVVIVIMAGLSNLDDLIEILNFNYAVSLLMEYSAFIQLRISKPNVHRPYRVPLGTTGCIIALIPTFAMTIIVILLASYKTFIVSILANIFGFSIYWIHGARKRKRFNSYTELLSTSPKSVERERTADQERYQQNSNTYQNGQGGNTHMERCSS